MRRSLLQHLTVTCLLLGSLTAAADEELPPVSNDISLEELAEAVYLAHPKRNGESVFQQLESANDAYANNLFAEPATVDIMHFNDQIGSGDGAQEWEGGVALPLWLPGQKQQQQALSQSISARLPAYQAAVKLDATGQLRTELWAVMEQAAQARSKKQIWENAQQLQQQVELKAEAGDLPRTEKMLAQSYVIESRRAYESARGQMQKALQQYTSLTGSQTLPTEVSEPLVADPRIDESHPELRVLDQHINQLRDEVGLSRYQNAINPSVTVGMKRERGAFGEAYNNSIGVGVTFALNDDDYRRPEIARAAKKLSDAEVNRQSRKIALERRLQVALEELNQRRQAMDLLQQEQAVTEEYLAARQMAFDYGEIDLTQLLQAQNRATKATLALEQQRIRIQSQIAVVNQVAGQSLD